MDKELDDLLDSALDDFDKKTSSLTTTQSTLTETQQETTSQVTIEKMNLYVDDIDYEDRPPSTFQSVNSKAFSKTFNNKPATSNLNVDDDMKLFEEIFSKEKTKENMKNITEAFDMFKRGGDEQKLLENFQKVMSELNLDNSDNEDEANIEDDLNFLKSLTQAAANIPTTASASSSTKPTNSESNSEFKDKNPLNKVLDDINKNSEKVLKNDSFPFGGSEFLSTLMGSGDSESDLDGASSLMMEPILNMLFSKDILYPSLKMMLENYEKYIEERKEKLNEAEIQKLNEQRECIRKMCSIYEAQKESDSKEVKSEQLKQILVLLEKCGMPPNELVPEINPFEGLSGKTNSPQCPVS